MKKVLGYVLIGISLAVIYIFCFTDTNKIALSVLSVIKSIKGETVNVKDVKTMDMHYDLVTWDMLLQKHVSLTGQVDYRGFKADHQVLENYLDSLSNFPPAPSWSQEQSLAYWINAYNAFTIKLIIDNWPVESIKHLGTTLPFIDSPWDIKFFKIGGVDFDLNTIEHEILRKQFEEPRIHFAIVCASRSCPNLMNTAYKADQIEEQLDKQVHLFINDPSKNMITPDQLELSKIFDWFKMDFTKQGSLSQYIQAYTKVDIANAQIAFRDYDWSLND